MKKDITTAVYKKVFGVDENHRNINQYVKAVIINFNNGQGDIIVENDNFKTRRKYACFTEGKKKAGLHPLQIVFTDIEMAKIGNDKYINENDEVCFF